MLTILAIVAAPARVTALQADNDHTTHSLTVHWEGPPGDYDAFALQLLDDAGIALVNRSLPATSRGSLLEGLTSGRWYRLKVATLSGGVASLEAAMAEGQTRELPLLLVYDIKMTNIFDFERVLKKKVLEVAILFYVFFLGVLMII